MGWKKWGYIKKGILIGVAIWLILFLLYQIGNLFECEGGLPVGSLCTNPLQNFVLYTFMFLSFPVLWFGFGGPMPGTLFVYSIVFFILWGTLIGWIIKKVKSTKKEIIKRG